MAQTRRIQTSILDVAYEDGGPSDGQPVVLLHGYPYDVHAFDAVVPLLNDKGFRTIVPYLRGCGGTRYERRLLPNVRHNPPQGAFTDFAQAIVDVGVKPQKAQTTDIVSHGLNAAREQPTVNLILATLRIVTEVLREWRRRYRSRRELTQYAYHERSDLGCAADIDTEIVKPFWRK
jgi:uncharacterized protein YjiS (DUF1127 family)